MLNIGGRDFRIAVAGRAVSAFGDGVALVALMLRLVSAGARPYDIALLMAAGGAPQLVLAGVVGRLVDRHDSRRLLVGAGLAEVACTLPLVVLHSVIAILVLVAMLGVAASVTSTTWSALVPSIVGEEHVAQAVSAQQSLSSLSMVAAPVAGGLLAGAFGSGLPLALDAASFAVITGAAACIRTRRRAVVATSEGAPARGGFGILRADAVLGPLTIGLGLVVLLVGMVDVVLVFLVRQTLHAGGGWYGTAEGAWMAGMVVGAIGAGRLGTERAQIWATVGGAGLACAALAPFAVVPAVWMLLPLSVLGGIGNGYAGAAFSALMLERTPDGQRGRVSAAVGATLGGAQGASLLLGGIVASVLSPRMVYAVGGLLGVGAAVVVATRCHTGRVGSSIEARAGGAP